MRNRLQHIDTERSRAAFFRAQFIVDSRAVQYRLAQAQVLQAKLFENPVISLEQNVYNRLNGKYFDFGKEGEAVVEIEQVIHLAGQRNKQVRLEKINKEIAEYQLKK